MIPSLRVRCGGAPWPLIPLLGFGDSPKPRLAAADAYSIELWADQLQHFVDEVVVAEDGADKATLGR